MSSKQRKLSERAQLKVEIARMRGELHETVAVLEERLNVPKRYGEFKADSKRRVRRWVHEKPVTAALTFTAITAVTGVTVWAIAKKVYRHL